MAFDVEALRAATPALPDVVHFNSASSGLVPREVHDTMLAHMAEELHLAPHEAGMQAAEALEATRLAAGALIGAQPDEIALTTSNSQGWNLAFNALPPLTAGDRVLVGPHEWGGNVMTLVEAARRAGAKVEPLILGEKGTVEPMYLGAQLGPDVRLVALSMVPAHRGLLEPVAEICNAARAHGAITMVDAAQAVGWMPIDVKGLGCDVMTAPGRKHLRGPKGTGFLYVRRQVQDLLTPAGLNVRNASWVAGGVSLNRSSVRFETNEMPVAALLGLGAALRMCRQLGPAAIRRATLARAADLRAALAQVPGLAFFEVPGAAGDPKTPILTFTIEGRPAGEVQQALAARGITVNAVPPLYAPLDSFPGDAAVLRASVSYLTTSEEIGILVDNLSRIVAA